MRQIRDDFKIPKKLQETLKMKFFNDDFSKPLTNSSGNDFLVT